MRLHLIAAVVVFLCACGGSTQVPVKGGEPEVLGIAGDWEGEYKSTESGRTGPVKFSLTVGRHTADGTVMMGGQTPLKVSFVEAEGGGGVNGKMEPYTDPSCNCMVETEFNGARTGDRIEGTFTSKAVDSGTAVTTGTWGVTRVAAQ
jgi:hypothetical protein